MIRAFRNLTALLALILLGAVGVHACECQFGGAAVCQDYWKASAVFVGTVVEITTVTTKLDGYERRQRLVRFSLDEPFRGVEGAQQYLVYASLFEGKLYTGICMRTKPSAAAVADLEYMRGLKTAKPGGAIYGEVTNYKRNEKGDLIRQAIAGAVVTVDGAVRREILSDANGAYRVDSLPAGDYSVNILPPASTTSRQTEQKIDLADGGCAFVGFWLENDGQLSGRVFNPHGLPINNAEVFLSEFDKERYRGHSDAAYSDAEGRYAFKQIPPGRYVLTIRFDGMTSQNRPFPLIYYPGVSNRSQAKVITMTEGQTINFDLEMPSLPLENEVVGSVVWSNGKPAVGARVGYMVVGDSVSYAIKNEDGGRFSLKAYQGLRLVMSASFDLEKGKQVYSDWVEVTVMPGLPLVKLILPQS
jgi:hypothetical protein